MIIPDINLLVYAYDDGAAHHDIARRWWDGLLGGEEEVGLPWSVTTGFVRLMSNPRAVSIALSPVEAADYVIAWFQRNHIVPLNPDTTHLEHFSRNLAVAGSGTNLVSDAHIAALAIEYSAEVHSNDSDFNRFPGVRWSNPLQPSGA